MSLSKPFSLILTVGVPTLLLSACSDGGPAEETAQDIGEQIDQMTEAAQEQLSEAADQVQQAADQLQESAREGGDQAAEQTAESAQEAGDDGMGMEMSDESAAPTQ